MELNKKELKEILTINYLEETTDTETMEKIKTEALKYLNWGNFQMVLIKNSKIKSFIFFLKWKNKISKLKEEKKKEEIKIWIKIMLVSFRNI